MGGSVLAPNNPNGWGAIGACQHRRAGVTFEAGSGL